MFRLKIALLSALLAGVLSATTGCAYTIPGSAESLASLLSSLNAPTGAIIPADIAVTNMRDGGTIQTGFLNGTANSENLAGVEVSVDGGAYTPATGTDTWSWQLPTGPTGMRLGRTHVLNIRTRDFRGDVSEPLSFTIKKDINKDINGDGYPDFMTSAWQASGGGRVYVFHGGPSGPGTRNASAADAIITGEGGGGLGGGTILADVNGDGYADAIVSDPLLGNGRIYIFHSSGSSGIASMGAASANTFIDGHTTGLQVGVLSAAGDLNNDGYTDLALRIDGANRALHLFQSTGTGGIPSQLTSAATAIISGASAGIGFPARFDLGDIDGDGFADLLGCASNAASNAGRAFIFLASGGALTTRTTAAADATITGESNSYLGADCRLADMNGDGYADLLLGSTQYNTGSGRVYMFYSAGTSGIASASAAAAPLIITGNTSSNFGDSLAAGDIDGDGTMDLVVGSPTYLSPNDNGGAFVYYNAISLTSGNASTLAGTIITSALVDQRQSNLVTLIDMNGDGYPDVITASSAKSMVVDEVHYFRAPGSGMIPSQDLGSGGTTDGMLTGETVNVNFGSFISH